jgi:hypothetical protein
LMRKGCLKVMVSRRERVVMAGLGSQAALRWRYHRAWVHRALIPPD